ncbi:hypothetical protein VB711_20940 [Cronbergia sp. UHCC 0137]|uniref:hypothetical protein n=1 Tax=Cronbergia sp. UHCC 0137 TaxID=3110239 RepID=UPI002B2073EF|nr:hypothetical protein [Cronbergia sp. UHCC 0137]MEA5620291.1 hypothetical protein [Cronbergia sp. UHCC 0137]
MSVRCLGYGGRSLLGCERAIAVWVVGGRSLVRELWECDSEALRRNRCLGCGGRSLFWEMWEVR